MRIFLLLAVLILVPLSSAAQYNSQIGFSINNDFFPGFTLHEDRFPGSSVYTLQLSYYEPDYTRLEYSLHYSRGYHQSVTYSAGFSAAYVIQLSDQFILKPGLGLDSYKLKDRTCRISFRLVMNSLFDVYEPCDDDVHASFNPFVTMKLELAEPLSIFVQTSYRAMLSSTDYVKGTITETGPNGGKIEREISGTKHSFYGAGLGVGFGIRINF